ncbi:MAG TPA: PilZ domain-containing protein [Gaiellales bacterium]|nr:PilZ domain-containing protein [Gaiellales bacterium]
MTPQQRLELALGILAELPTTIELLSEDGGAVLLEVTGHDGEMLHAHAPGDRIRLGLGLRLRLRGDVGRGYDIQLCVADTAIDGGGRTVVKLTVEHVRRRNGERAAPRARVNDLALVGIVYTAKPKPRAEFDVRLVDASPNGVAFVTDQELSRGDLLSVTATIDGRLVRLDARVLYTLAERRGRNRVGCEVTSIGGNERALLALLAALESTGGSSHDRAGLRKAS